MKLTLFSVLISFALLACSTTPHNAMRGSVAMKLNDQEAHVCMGDKEVKAGDRVALFRNVCSGTSGGKSSGNTRTCEKVRLGEGVVERPLNEHYSLVRVQPGVTFEEGTVVEKL